VVHSKHAHFAAVIATGLVWTFLAEARQQQTYLNRVQPGSFTGQRIGS
jgi:tRNA A37 threonylcarbamoyladenosine modification protein TsaB